VDNLSTNEIVFLFVQFSLLSSCITIFTYLVNRREVEQFVKKYTTDQERTLFKHTLDQSPQAIVIASNLDCRENTKPEAPVSSSAACPSKTPKIQFCNLAA